jgi:[acyl-carrier-protein] S-malonyltransferase
VSTEIHHPATARPLGGLAFVFPGQGSQAPGMGAELARQFPVCRRVFEEADEALSFSISRLCFEGPASELQLTANTQPAILTVSVAVDRLLGSRGVRPSFAAGHSLGEYSALVAAGVLTLKDAVRAVRLRGEAMQEAVPQGVGAMAAILGLDPGTVGEVCRESAEGEIVAPANFNSPEQTVIAGHAGAVTRASKRAVARGAVKAVPLPVSAPFHCALMKPAEERLEAHLAGVRFADPAFPVVVNVEARPVTTGEEARRALVRQVCSPVRWVESVVALRGMGARLAIEAGPGKVLSGLIRRIERAIACRNVEDAAGLQTALAALGEGAVPASAPGGGASEGA